MQRRWAVAIVFLLMAEVALPASPGEDAMGAIDNCLLRLDVDVDVGFERISARCPQLARHMHGADWAAWLPAGWNDPYNDVSARSLVQLQMLVVRELAVRTGTRTPAVAGLRPILADFAVRNQQGSGWWARFEKWLHTVLAASEPHPRSGGFDRLAGRVSVSQAVIELVTYGTLACIVVLAGFIVVNEWRVAGIYRRRGAGSEGAKDAYGEASRLLSWQDVERAAPTDKARVLLELLALRLTAARRLPASGALTVRELMRAAQLQDAVDRERLFEVAFAAERLRFSAESLPSETLAAVIERGRELLQRLSAAAVPPREHGGPA
jgi:hypothetical protein